MASEVSLTRGLVALVDDEDAERVAPYSWWPVPYNCRFGGWYAYTQVNGRTIYLHRFVMDAAPGVLVGHRSSDGLDCRRANLRLSTPTLSNATRRGYSPASGFRGVYPTRSRRFQAQIWAHGTTKRLGRFDAAEDAARAYDAAALAAFGPFATLNFPDELRSAA